MTNQNNTSLKIKDFKKTCEAHEQITMALFTLIENDGSKETIKLIANDVREQAELILAKSRVIELV